MSLRQNGSWVRYEEVLKENSYGLETKPPLMFSIQAL